MYLLIYFSEVIDWKCHLILHDPGKRAHNLRASLRFQSNPKSERYASAGSTFHMSFSENPDTIKASRDAHNRNGSDRDGMPPKVLDALLEPGRITASAAWSWKGGLWKRQFCVPLPASLFSACECREFVLTGSVQYTFDICGSLFMPTYMCGDNKERTDRTISANAVVADVSVLRSDRELGIGAVLVPSKPDLTGRRTYSCAWSSLTRSSHSAPALAP